MIERRQIPAPARKHLRAADPTMRSLVDRLGVIEYPVDADVWRAVVGSIVGQQLSVKAASTIRGRVAALGTSGFPSPEEIIGLSDDRLRECGLSRAKTSYVKSAAESWKMGAVKPDSLVEAPDEEVITVLSSLRGVGRWTAEMVLIFSLGRPDVLAVDDLGIRAAVQRAYGLEMMPSREYVRQMGEAWKPFRSYASLYLWESLRLPRDAVDS